MDLSRINKQFKTKGNPEQRIVREQETDITTNKCSISKKLANKKDKRSLKTLRNFCQKLIHSIWFDLDISLFALEETRF